MGRIMVHQAIAIHMVARDTACHNIVPVPLMCQARDIEGFYLSSTNLSCTVVAKPRDEQLFHRFYTFASLIAQWALTKYLGNNTILYTWFTFVFFKNKITCWRMMT